MPNEPKTGKNLLVAVAIVLLLCAGVGAWLFFRSRQEKTSNQPPIAALRLDSLDETNRVVTLSDNGSRDPDGTLQSWRIAWGDGKEDKLSSIPQKAAHTYASEGQYTISLWCVDNSGATSTQPATRNITFDFLKRQKALEQAQAESKSEAERLKEAERLEQERQKELAAQEARKQQELEEKRKAEELARQKENEGSKTTLSPPPTPKPTPVAAALPDDSSSGKVIFTPRGYTLGEFQISKEKTEGMQRDGNLLVILAIRCVNFPDTPIVTSKWQIDGKELELPAGRIRASLSPGEHEVTALFTGGRGSSPMELKADVTVGTNGECIVKPRK